MMSPNVKIIIITLSFPPSVHTYHSLLTLNNSEALHNQSYPIPVSHEDNEALTPSHAFPFFPPCPFPSVFII